LNVGERIEAQVLEVDVENKRISLGIKQLQANPWDEIEAKYPIR
jgi:small subunit ribosomal protein S1